MLFVNRRTGFCAEIDFRLFCRGDGGAFRRCVEDFYGDGYPYREYLDEEFLLGKIAAGDMTVLCGVTDKGEIVSTSALCMSREFKGSALLMLRVVKRAYRDMGIGGAQEDRLFQIAGWSILKNIEEMPKLSIGARWHHERYSGGGYPDALSGEEIPEEARIIAVADSYDAMASKRSYRDALPQKVVREEIVKGKGTQFDPVFADIFLQMIDNDKEYRMRDNSL